jgi:chemotaxis protein histidine kinase CheA
MNDEPEDREGTDEQARAEAEQLAAQQEQARTEAERARAEAERLAAEQEQARTEAEHARAEAEQRATQQEQARTEAEQARLEAERRTSEQEQATAQAELARAEAERRATKQEKAREKAEKRARKTEEKTSETEVEAIKLSASYAEDATKAGIPRQVALYAQWEGSSTRAMARARVFLCGVFAFLCLLGAIAIGTVTATDNLRVSVGAPWGGVAFLIAIAAISFGTYWYAHTLAHFLSEREQATAAADGSGDGDKDKDKDLEELLRLNRTQMQAYQALSRGQQRSAFRSSLIALFVGLVVLVGGVVVVVLVKGDTSKVAIAGVAALGSALSSYIASTYLQLHGEAARQLRFFSDQPIITSYIYEAERLVTKIPVRSRPAIYRLVIKDVMEVAKSGALSASRPRESVAEKKLVRKKAKGSDTSEGSGTT